MHVFVRASRLQHQTQLIERSHQRDCCALEQERSKALVLQPLARVEAILTEVPGDRELRLLLEQLEPGPACTFSWLDQRNGSLALLPASTRSVNPD